MHLTSSKTQILRKEKIFWEKKFFDLYIFYIFVSQKRPAVFFPTMKLNKKL